MRWIRWLAISTAVLVGLAAVLLLVLFNIDYSRFKDDVERYVSQATDREFSIGGEFQASLGRTVSLRVEDVRLGNAEGSSNPDMLQVGLFELRVDLWSLISGPIWIQHLELDRARIFVEADAEGRSNWAFGPEMDAPEEVETGGGGVPRIVLERVDIEDFSLRYGEGWLDTARTVQVTHCTIEEGSDELLTLSLDGRLDDFQIAASGQAGPLENLLQGEDMKLDITVGMGEFRLATRGFIEDVSPFRRPDLSFEMTGPDIANLLEEVGSPVFTSGPLDLRGNLNQTEPGVKLDVTGAVGEVKLDVHGTLEDPQRFRGLKLDFDTSGPDLAKLVAPFGIDYLPAGAFQARGQLQGDQPPFQLHDVFARVGEVSADVRGTIGAKGIDLQATGSGPDLAAFVSTWTELPLPAVPFEADGGVRYGLYTDVVEIPDSTAVLENGIKARFDGSLGDADDLLGMNARVEVSGPELAEMLGLWMENPLLAGAFEVGARMFDTRAGFGFEGLEAKIGESRLQFDGVLGQIGLMPDDFSGLDARVRLSGPDLPALFAEAGLGELPEGAFDISAGVKSSASGVMVEKLVASLGEYRFTLDGTLGQPPEFGGLEITTSASGPSLRELTARELPIRPPPGRFETSATVRAIPTGFEIRNGLVHVGEYHAKIDAQLPREGITGLDLRADLVGPDLNALLPPEHVVDATLPYSARGHVRLDETSALLDQVDIRVGELQVAANGTVPVTSEVVDAELTFSASAPNLGRITKALAAVELPEEPFRVEGHYRREANGYHMDRFDTTVGPTHLAGTLSYAPGDKPRVTADLHSELLDLTPFLGTGDEADDQEDSDPQAPQPASDRRIPDIAVPVDYLDLADVDLRLAADEFKLPDREGTDLGLRLLLQDNRLTVDPIQAKFQRGTYAARLSLDAEGDVPSAAAEARARDVIFQKPFDEEGNPLDRPATDIDAKLTASGKTLRQLAASANGTMRIAQGAGKIENVPRGLLTGDLLNEIFRAINPFSREEEPYTTVECSIVLLDIVDGLATSRALAWQTDKLKIGAQGTVSFATEAINLTFSIKQRRGIGVSVSGIVSPFVRVSGTIMNPNIQLDAKRGSVSGTAAVLTGGLSILARGMWDRFLSADNVCKAALERAAKAEADTAK